MCIATKEMFYVSIPYKIYYMAYLFKTVRGSIISEAWLDVDVNPHCITFESSRKCVNLGKTLIHYES